MLNNLRQQYRELVRDALKFIETPDLAEHRVASSSKSVPKTLSHNSASKIHPPVENSPAAPPTNETDVPASVKKKTVAQKKSGWELQTVVAADHQRSFYKKLSPFVPLCDPQIPVWLILPEENPEHRLFLENVSRAITRSFAAACVMNYSEKLLSSAKVKIVLIPVDLLKKKYPECQPHKAFQTDFFTVLPMGALETYAEDVQSKRALWTAIQNLFQS